MLRDNDNAAREYDTDGINITAPTEDIDMQVMLDDGFFHREMDYTTTACDKPIPHVGQWRRNQKYEGPFCEEGCYSKPEIARAKKRNAEIKADENDEDPMHDEETRLKWQKPR